MKPILEDIFGSALTEYVEIEASLPIYLSAGKTFFRVIISGMPFTIVSIDKKERLNVAALKKQFVKYHKTFHTEIAYAFDMVTTFQRRSLIENGIPFLSGNGQVYLPFLGTYFGKCQRQNYNNEVELFTPATQILLLYMIYTDKEINKGDAARNLGISPMSVSRASAELTGLNLLQERKTGTEIVISLTGDKKDVYHHALPHLMNPVHSIAYVEKTAPVQMVQSGEYALSQRSNLGYPQYFEYAVSKKEYGANAHKEYDPDIEMDVDLMRIQKWKYSPTLFSNETGADPISLICSFQGNADERIHKCLMDIEKEIESWHIMNN